MSQTTVSRNQEPNAVAGSLLFFRGHSARILDAVLMGLVIMRINAPFLPVDVPLAQVALIVLLFVAAFRRPTRSLERVRWYPVVAVALLLYLAIVSLVQDVDFIRRLGNIAVLMTVAGFLASGRIDVASGLKGLGAALIINTGLFYAGVAPDTYGGVLTGFLTDKNAAGLVYGIGALLLTLTTQRVWLRALILLGGAAALVLTDSRTSMAAYVGAAIWIAVSPRLGIIFRALLAGGIGLAFAWADANLADVGEYAVTRAGSDQLRESIDAAAEAKVADTPWYGGGLGEAFVEIDEEFWFFHNAYHGLLAEGGVVALIAVVAIYALGGFSLLARNQQSYAVATVGAATVFLFLAATRLGEVFFAPIGFVLLGVGLALTAEHDPFEPDPRLHLALQRQ